MVYRATHHLARRAFPAASAGRASPLVERSRNPYSHHMTSVAVVGSINSDVIVSCERFPEAGETVPGGTASYGQGGKGANQARAAACAGAATTFIGAVGDDTAADRVLTPLAGVDLRVRTVPGPTGTALITVDGRGENTIVVVPGANASLTLSDDDRRIIAAADVLLVQLEVPIPVVLDATRAASRAGTTVMLNPSPVLDLPNELWSAVDVAVVNAAESHALVSHLADVRTVVTTMGAAGATLRGPGGDVHVEGLSVDVVDTTGAGDAFTGTLAASWLDSPADRLASANAAGAFATTVAGAESTPTPDQVDALLNQASG